MIIYCLCIKLNHIAKIRMFLWWKEWFLQKRSRKCLLMEINMKLLVLFCVYQSVVSRYSATSAILSPKKHPNPFFSFPKMCIRDRCSSERWVPRACRGKSSHRSSSLYTLQESSTWYSRGYNHERQCLYHHVVLSLSLIHIFYKYEENLQPKDADGFPVPQETGFHLKGTYKTTLKAQTFQLLTDIQ